MLAFDDDVEVAFGDEEGAVQPDRPAQGLNSAFSSALSMGSRLYDWKTKPMWFWRTAASFRSGSAESSRPLEIISSSIPCMYPIMSTEATSPKAGAGAVTRSSAAVRATVCAGSCRVIAVIIIGSTCCIPPYLRILCTSSSRRRTASAVPASSRSLQSCAIVAASTYPGTVVRHPCSAR